MESGFISARRRGLHYELARRTVAKLQKVNLLLKGKSERGFEQTIVGHLRSSPKIDKNLIDQLTDSEKISDEVEKVTPANLFGFKHRADAALGHDGTAIEIKVVRGSQEVRGLLGQALAYRMHYRFVILVIIDKTKDRQIVDLCKQKGSDEHNLLKWLAKSLNVFTVVGPLGRSKNISFFPPQKSK